MYFQCNFVYQAREFSLVPACLLTVQFVLKPYFMKPLTSSPIITQTSYVTVSADTELPETLLGPGKTL